MQVLLLGIFVAIYLHDASTAVQVYRGGELVRMDEAMPGDVWPGLSAWAVLLVVLLPKLLVASTYWITCRRTRRKLGTPRGQRALNLLEAMTAALPFLLLGLFILDLSAGALRSVRVSLHHVVLIDEVLVMLPTLLVAVLAWSAYYPVDRRLREALIMRDADAGRPVYPLLERGGYVAMQLRHQFGLLLLPLLAVYGWAETLVLLGPDFGGPLSRQAANVLTPLGVLVVFIGAPLVIRHIWQTTPLAQGEVRERMLAMCQQHKVRVRELLLWQTSGRMINAAVTGLISKVRYILLSDGLLDQLGAREVEAVMAHELAHVKLKHLIWMGLMIIAALGVLEMTAQIAFVELLLPLLGNVTLGAIASETGIDLYHPQTQSLIIAVPSFVIAILAFGWVSRRIERQADVFAVKHLAITSEDKQHDPLGKQVFDNNAVETMVRALQRVSELNHMATTSKNWRQDLIHWRHGTIAWRQAYLRSIVGKPIDDADIDRVLLRVKIATLAGLAIVAALYLL